MIGLKKWREENELSQQELGDLVGLSAGMVCRIENGDRAPSLETKVRIARVLGIRIKDLFPVERAVTALAQQRAHRVLAGRDRRLPSEAARRHREGGLAECGGAKG